MSEELCRVGVVSLIHDSDGRILMERRTVAGETKRTWSFIAGGKKAGETVVEAAKREVDEEVDAEFVPEEIIGVVDHDDQRSGDTSWTVIGLTGELCGEPVNNEPHKRDKIEWKDAVPDNLHPISEMMWDIYNTEKLHSEL